MRQAGIAVMMALALGLVATGAAAAEHGGEKGMHSLEGQNVAILTGEGFHDAETMMPLAYLTNRGANVTVIGAEAGEVKAYNSDVRIVIEKAVADVSPGDFHALVLPGGQAPARIREHAGAVEFAREFFESGKPVAAICHGPQILVTAGVVDGKQMTCVAGVADEVTEAGGVYRDEAVVRDGNLITSRVPGDIPVWLAAMEEQIKKSKD